MNYVTEYLGSSQEIKFYRKTVYHYIVLVYPFL